MRLRGQREGVPFRTLGALLACGVATISACSTPTNPVFDGDIDTSPDADTSHVDASRDADDVERPADGDSDQEMTPEADVEHNAECGDGRCEPGETGTGCPHDCLTPEAIRWQPFAMRNDWQARNGHLGGEGFQMVMDMDWSLADPNVIYLVVDTMRVWKSTDRGLHWEPLMLDAVPSGGDSIVSDPLSSDVVFVMLVLARSAAEGGGIYRTLDGGASWEGPLGSPIFREKRHGGKLFLFDPTSGDGTRSQVIFAGTPTGVLRSDDGGDRWQELALASHDVYDLEWAEVGSELYVSTDQGLYVVDADSGLDTEIPSLGAHPWDVAVDPRDRQTLYVVTGTDEVFKSLNGGASFFHSDSGVQSGHNLQRVSVCSSDPERLYLSPHRNGGLLPYWSDDSGATWNRPASYATEECLACSYYWSKRVVFDPIDPTVAVFHSGGAIVRTEDGGQSWHYSGDGYTGARLEDIRFLSPEEMLFCLTDYGLFRTDDGGDTFVRFELPRARGARSCGAVDVLGDTIIATTGEWTDKDIIISIDRGESWSTVQEAAGAIKFLRYNSSSPDIVYASRWVSRDGGASWNRVPGGYSIRAMDPHDGNHAIGVRAAADGEGHEVALSEDGALSWEILGSTLTRGTPDDVVIDPHSSELHVLVAATAAGIYEYREGDWTLRNDTAGLESEGGPQGIHYVRFDPRNPGIAWAARRGYGRHSDGIYLSMDGGGSWQNVINNLGPYNNCFNLEVSPFDSTVYVTGPGIFFYR